MQVPLRTSLLAVVASAGVLMSASLAAQEAPDGVEPLDTDMFTTDDFYQDREHWDDPRYYRCNTSRDIFDLWTDERFADSDNVPESAQWGDCNTDVDTITAPHDYETAEEHYNALLDDAEERGGPTQYTRETAPDWDGFYDSRGNRDNQWTFGENVQVSSLVEPLSPLYQQYLVQEVYHEGVSNAPQWSASYCWPEGLWRFWSYGIRDIEVISTHHQVQFLTGTADNFIRKVLLGRDHVRENNQWLGETVGFWDEETLIAWTDNVHGWNLSHSLPEHSDQFQVIEVFNMNDEGNIEVESTFYDQEAFEEPLYVESTWEHMTGPMDPEHRHTFIECNPTIFPVDGVATPVSPGTTIEYTVPDMFDRPWAQQWYEHHEEGMERPDPNADLFGF